MKKIFHPPDPVKQEIGKGKKSGVKEGGEKTGEGGR
jgi:hypothetical protein